MLPFRVPEENSEPEGEIIDENTNITLHLQNQGESFNKWGAVHNVAFCRKGKRN